MIHIKAPNDYSAHIEGRKSIFLAGSIEMGKADRWQDRVATELSDKDVLILNPRRNNWNSNWEQSIDNPKFKEQVEWELQALEDADIILMYLQSDTMSPISLLEFGLYAKSNPQKLIVCCPDGFWRKGNIDITATKYGIKIVDTKEDMITLTKKIIACWRKKT